MGYVRERKLYSLVWETGEFAGLEVQATSAGVGLYMTIASLASEPIGNPPSVEDLNRLAELYEAFAPLLKSWNLEESDGVPVPATLKGLLSQDPPFVMAVVEAWMEAVAGVAAPLGEQSNGGEPFPEGSIPMDVLSPSL